MIIAICDKEKLVNIKMGEICKKYLCGRISDFKILNFFSGEELLFYKGKIDVVFLSIEQSGINGIEIKNQFEKEHRNIKIIFLANHSGYMQDAFGGEVYGYLIKPINIKKIVNVLCRIIKIYRENLIIEIDNVSCQKINIRDILFIKAEDKYTLLNSNNEEIISRRTIKEWESILKEYPFYKVHRSYLVNFRKIKKPGKIIILETGDEIEVSRRNVKKFREDYYNYIME